MGSWVRRIDMGLARGEAAIAATVLLAMVVLAALQALLRNLTNLELDWANAALAQMTWIDPVLQKGTLWLAFLGASLATHGDKHIAIDVLHRVAPVRVRQLMQAAVGFFAGLVSFYLSRVFFLAVINNAQDRPLEYEALTASGPVHICEASASSLADAQLARPDIFCAFRWGFEQVNVAVETPEGALQLVVPAMFMVIAVRLIGKGIASVLAFARAAPGGQS